MYVRYVVLVIGEMIMMDWRMINVVIWCCIFWFFEYLVLCMIGKGFRELFLV